MNKKIAWKMTVMELQSMYKMMLQNIFTFQVLFNLVRANRNQPYFRMWPAGRAMPRVDDLDCH